MTDSEDQDLAAKKRRALITGLLLFAFIFTIAALNIYKTVSAAQ